jgi:Mn-dependent DtxR family transcriptional regulator
MQSPFWPEIAHDTDIHRGEVAKILSKLRRRGFLTYEEKPRSILLTDAGMRVALEWYQQKGDTWRAPHRWKYL